MLCEIQMCDFKFHFLQDFLAYCTQPVSVHLAMACVGCLFKFFSLFAQFKSTKSHENYVFLYPFFNMAISPQNNEKTVFYASKPCGLTGMGMAGDGWDF